MPLKELFLLPCCSAAFLFLLAGCDSPEPKEGRAKPPGPGISSACSGSINGHRILFAHMSVGNDILAGLALANAALDPPIAIREIDAGAPAAGAAAGISHFKIGSNAQPLRKIADFRTFLLSNNNGQAFDCVGIKLCYVDISAATDIQAVLQEYERLVRDVAARYPHIRFVHFTVPLTAHCRGLKSRIKNFILGDRDNIQRNRYNTALRDRYTSGAVIDIARAESTFADGGRMEHAFFRTRHYSLIPAYTTDGGHLNETGKRVVAAAFAEGLCRALAD